LKFFADGKILYKDLINTSHDNEEIDDKIKEAKLILK